MSSTIVIAGGSGFLGKHLAEELRGRRHRVVTLTRKPSTSDDESTWDPDAGVLDATLVRRADAVVNLAGTPLLGNPHSKKWAASVRSSRVTTTRLLAETIAAASEPPAFLAGNGIAWYGDHGGAELTEASDTRGHAFLTEVSREWEEAARPASESGARVCVLRTSPVMDRRSPPLAQLRLLFLAGLGGKLGNGQQYMPMISRRDWIGAVAHPIESGDARGPFNLTCPEPGTNADFTRALAGALHRPAIARVPGPLLSAATGKLSPELLGSVRVRPAALEEAGYRFSDRGVAAVVAAGLA